MEEDIIRARLSLEVRSLAIAEHHAAELARLGFKVIKVGSRGVSFEGEKDRFAEVFRTEVQLSPSPRFVREPTLPEAIREEAASVYFPTPPTFFKGG